jgi:hypothetical protein
VPRTPGTHRLRRRVPRPVPLAAAGALVATAAVALPHLTPEASAATTLRGYADGRGVEIGAAVGDTPLTSDASYSAVLDREFNSVTAENAMKWGAVEPSRGSFTWAAAGRLVAHAAAHHRELRGQTRVHRPVERARPERLTVGRGEAAGGRAARRMGVRSRGRMVHDDPHVRPLRRAPAP